VSHAVAAIHHYDVKTRGEPRTQCRGKLSRNMETQNPTWMVEFEGQRRSLESIWSDELAKIVGPLRDSLNAALAGASTPSDLYGLVITIYAEDGEWGFKLGGPATAVQYAIDMIGQRRELTPRPN
jgi:hypothetical protein